MPDGIREQEEEEGKLLLSLDSGWFESPNFFSQLHVIDDVLRQYEQSKGLPEHSVKAYEVFDMIIGTGSGGLLAVMLGPLKMTTREALTSVQTLHQSVFNPPEPPKPRQSKSKRSSEFLSWLMCKPRKSDFLPESFDPEPLGSRLANAVHQLVEQRLGQDGLSIKMQKVEQIIPGCKIAVTAMTSAHAKAPTVFRGYDSKLSSPSSPDCTLVDAVRATMADPRHFHAVTFGQPTAQTYVAVDVGHFNPIQTALQEAGSLFNEKSITAILSIGSGKHEVFAGDCPPDFPARTVRSVSFSHAAFERARAILSPNPEAHYRFEVDHLRASAATSPADVEADSLAYLAREEVIRKTNALVRVMCSRTSTVRSEEISQDETSRPPQYVKYMPIAVSTLDSLKGLPRIERASFDLHNGCLKGTREHILPVIFKWMEEEGPKPPIMWLEGVLGSGKSFVAHSVAMEAHRLRILGASFFVTPGSGVREGANQPSTYTEPPSLKNIVSSLILDLGGLCENFRIAVAGILGERPCLATAAPSVQLTDLLLPSLSSLSKDRTFVWVIDGFDELMRYPDREVADSFFATLCSPPPSFPPNFIIFITSRPLSDHRLNQTSSIRLLLLDVSSQENTKDLDLIADAELKELAAANRAFSALSPSDQLSIDFRTKSQGYALWFRIVKEHLIRSSSPNQELRELVDLDGHGSSDVQQLIYSTYAEIIQRSIDLTHPNNRKALKHVILVFLALQRPLPLVTILDMLENSSELPSQSFVTIISHLCALLLGFNSSNPLEFIHLSLRDFFTSSAEFSDLIEDVPSPRDLSPGHFTLLQCAFQVMGSCLRQEVLVEKQPHDPSTLAYAAAAWPYHITCLNSKTYSMVLAQPLSKFLDNSFFAWLEYHTTIGIPFMFTQEFLARVKPLAPHIWDDKVLSQRQTVEKLDQLRSQFEHSERLDDWLLCSSVAVDLWRARVDSHSNGEDERCLYMAVENKARGLEALTLHKEALSASEEAVALCRSLVQRSPQDSKPEDLPLLLARLSSRLSAAGRHGDALSVMEEAIPLKRQLAKAHPKVFVTNFANSLTRFASLLSDAGRDAEALAALEEAIPLLRQLGNHLPEEFEAELAISLYNLSNHLAHVGRLDEAETSISESIALFRQIVRDRRKVYEDGLARSLNAFSDQLVKAGRRPDALVAIEESTSLYRQFAQDHPKVLPYELAVALKTLSDRLSDEGRRVEALAAIEESILTYRQIRETKHDHPTAFHGSYARALIYFSVALSDAGRHADAFAAGEESVKLYRQLAQDEPKVYQEGLAIALNDFADDLSGAGRYVEALAMVEEAISLCHQLVQERPQRFKGFLRTVTRTREEIQLKYSGS
ncbi:hypothetical protein DL96DRAFT_890265 [Flagelloscypha sp. PMI_526]|nr:hypothetical protein DL96DRAFT_890265 [Flagelloscypha sp. PMI_526]